MKWVALLDCNNFFVSCERLFRPDLRTVPTLVLSSNDGCVVARSQEVKDMGIPMGAPYFHIKDTIKDKRTAVFSSNFTFYRDISRRVFEVMRLQVDEVEQYSIDEAFCSLQGSETEVLEQARQLRALVQQRVGIPVSIGVACTKTQAKYANQVAKQGRGVCVLSVAAWLASSSQIPLASIWGVGGSLAARFRTHGLESVAQFCAADRARIERLFGLTGTRLRSELMGVCAYSITKQRLLQKTLMSSRSFASPSTSLAVLEDAVAYHVRQVASDLRAMRCVAGQVRIMIRPSRHGDFALRGGSLETTFVSRTDDTILLLRESIRLLHQLYEPQVPYKKAGVQLSIISPVEHAQAELFSVPTTTAGIAQLLDQLNHRWGRETVRVGDRMLGDKWRVKEAYISPRYTTSWSDLPVVKA